MAEKTQKKSLLIYLVVLLAGIAMAAGIAFTPMQQAAAADEDYPLTATEPDSDDAYDRPVVIYRIGDFAHDCMLGDSFSAADICRANNVNFDPSRLPNVANIKNLTGAFTGGGSDYLEATKTGEDYVNFLYRSADTGEYVETGYYEATCGLMPTGVKLDKTAVTIGLGETVQLTATTEPEDADDGITWTSDNEKKATVSKYGEVTAVALGKTTIHAKTYGEGDASEVEDGVKTQADDKEEAKGGYEATCVVTVKKAQTITAADVTGEEGETGKKIEAKTDGGGKLSYEVTSGSDIVSVDKTGALTLKKAGTAKVTVTAAETKEYAPGKKVVTVTVNTAVVIPTYTLSYDANGGTGTMDSVIADEGTTVALEANKFTRSGYTFAGWNTAKDGSGTTYKDKAELKLTENTTLYAQWTKNLSAASKTAASPKTGDTLPVVMFSCIALAAVAILLGTGVKLRKDR